MKRKFVILSLVLACYVFAGCSVSSDESRNTSAGTEMVTDQDDSIVDVSKIEQIYIDEYNTQNDNLKCVEKIIEKLGDNGFVAIDSDNKVDMTNADYMMQFISSRESEKHAEISVLQVFYIGGLNYIEISTNEGNVSVEQTYYVFQDNRLTQTAHSEFQADYCEYSDEGYLLIEGSWHSPEMYVLTMSEEEEHIALRVEPIDEPCKALCEKYIAYVSYNLNNMFITNWSQDNFGNLDFYFIKYHEGYRDSFDAIPGELFEEVMTTYLPVTVSDLRTVYEYDETTETYRQETVYNSPYPPFLEVTDYQCNSDGTITLYADGVWPDYNSDYAFTSVIVVKPFDDGTFRIISNDVTEQELKLPPVAYS